MDRRIRLKIDRSLSPYKKCFCAFCRVPRRVYKKRRLSFANVLATGLVSGTSMYAIWHGWNPRVFLIFLPLLLLSELFIQMRWRFAIVCKNCGFDPVLYVKSPEKAAARVKEFLEQTKADPNYLRTRPLNLPFIAKDRVPATGKGRGSLVSKQI